MPPYLLCSYGISFIKSKEITVKCFVVKPGEIIRLPDMVHIIAINVLYLITNANTNMLCSFIIYDCDTVMQNVGQAENKISITSQLTS